MRVFLLTLMIALLPLRSWMGDAMALERSVSAQQAMTVTAVQDKCHELPQHGLHEAATISDPAHAHAHAHAQDDGDSCTDCQICHSIALTPTLLPTQAPQTRMRQPLALTRLHASADPSPGFKPPIVSA